jgi:hypothetical protein
MVRVYYYRGAHQEKDKGHNPMSEFETIQFNFGKCKTAQFEMDDGKWIVCQVDDKLQMKQLDEVISLYCSIYKAVTQKRVLNRDNIFEVKANRFAMFEKKPTKRQIQKMFDAIEHGTNDGHVDPWDEQERKREGQNTQITSAKS